MKTKEKLELTGSNLKCFSVRIPNKTKINTKRFEEYKTGNGHNKKIKKRGIFFKSLLKACETGVCFKNTIKKYSIKIHLGLSIKFYTTHSMWNKVTSSYSTKLNCGKGTTNHN